MQKYCFLAFLLSVSLLSAQSNILKNKDIIWAAVIEQDWVIDTFNLENEWQHGVLTLKMARESEGEIGWTSPYLADFIFDAVQAHKLQIYKDAELKFPQNDPWAGAGGDTVITYDPVTYEAQLVCVENQFDTKRWVVSWRVRQLLCFHKKSGTWSSSVISMAPLGPDREHYASKIPVPLFWFKPSSKHLNRNHRNIVWAKKTFSDKQPGTVIPVLPTNLVKTTPGFENPVAYTYQRLIQDKKAVFFDSQGKEKMSRGDKTRLTPRMDTTFVNYPGTGESEIVYTPKGITADSIHQLRLVQTWCWNKKKRELSISLESVAFMGNIRDNGYSSLTAPFFYKRAAWRKQHPGKKAKRHDDKPGEKVILKMDDFLSGQ